MNNSGDAGFNFLLISYVLHNEVTACIEFLFSYVDEYINAHSDTYVDFYTSTHILTHKYTCLHVCVCVYHSFYYVKVQNQI